MAPTRARKRGGKTASSDDLPGDGGGPRWLEELLGDLALLQDAAGIGVHMANARREFLIAAKAALRVMASALSQAISARLEEDLARATTESQRALAQAVEHVFDRALQRLEESNEGKPELRRAQMQALVAVREELLREIAMPGAQVLPTARRRGGGTGRVARGRVRRVEVE